MDDDDARRFLEAEAGPRLRLAVESFARLTGRPLLEGGDVSPAALWRAPFGLLAHGVQPDPVLFYGNRRALELFELAPEQLVRMPSRLTAESDGRAERAELLDQVAQQGFIDNYAGVRVSAMGRRFRIEGATVWNLIDRQGARRGQAAAIRSWTLLD